MARRCLPAPPAERQARVQNGAIGMMDHLGRGPSVPHRHVERVHDERAPQRVAHRPPDDAAAPRIQHRRQIEPSPPVGT